MSRRAVLEAILLIALVCLSKGAGPLCAAECCGWLLPPEDCPQEAVAEREAYVPRPGDIVLYAHDSLRSRFLYTLAHTGKPYHAGIVVNLPDGRPAILEAGPYDLITVYLMDALPRFRTHEGTIWVRRRRVPLTAEQSARLTAFALEQTGKRFALFRVVLEATPLRVHGPLRRRLLGSSRIDRQRWFCSELVIAALAVVGVVDPHTIKPNTVYPRDLFYDRPFDLKPCWEVPRRWTCEP
ncbi:MAG TPA: hypothetical protein VH575_35730 [Gemmataceae bacterium]|jgi:hypothetical protein